MFPIVTMPKNSINTEVFSRQEIINWINKTLNYQYRKIEDLSSGAAYCQIINILFPGSIPSRKIKAEARLEHEMLNNYKCLQNTFRKCGIEKEIPIMNLIKGRFQDHLIFAQWFKRFYDANICYDKNEMYPPSNKGDNISQNILHRSHDSVHNIGLHQNSNMIHRQNNSSPSSQHMYNHQKLVINPEIIGLKSELNKMKEEYEEDQQTIFDLSRERQFYYQKLCNIEMLCHEHQNSEYSDIVTKLQEILFKEEEGFVAPNVED